MFLCFLGGPEKTSYFPFEGLLKGVLIRRFGNEGFLTCPCGAFASFFSQGTCEDREEDLEVVLKFLEVVLILFRGAPVKD